ncbi:MAG: tannase/feruloyl esterase family alpha/beta hydrolase [Caulobacteraceae bacterium]|nr:tannase/feruloyl esterase family alpha/beta hydrolase [Caulobacteraceae bacterium]
MKSRLLACGGAVGALMLFHASTASAGTCETAAIQAMAPADTVITSATPTAAPLPHCRIEGYITTTNPGPNRVNFRLQLPDSNWQNRYYFIGMGGAAGYVPSDSQIPAGNPLVQGFAVAGTDTGHTGDILDWSFLADPAKARDHIDRGAHVTAVATQQITRAYYGGQAFYRYTSGCSGGGRMTTEAIERHPEDYDGVLLGAPGGRSSATMLAFINAAQQMAREPGSWVSPAKFAMLDAKVTAACDEIDGAKDEIIQDHTKCHFDFDTLACADGDKPDCLTQPELKSIKSIVAGPRSPSGQIKVGFPISNMSVWAGFMGQVPPPWSDASTPQNMMRSSPGYIIGSSLAKVLFGPDFDVMKMDLNDQATIDRWWEATKKLDFGWPYSANLAAYHANGGKVLMWNGVSDPCCIDTEMEQYYKDAATSVGGMDDLRTFASFYRVPGMGHCGSGTGPGDAPDMLMTTLINWVEKGEAPGPVVAHRGTDRQQLLFADPGTRTVSGVLVPPPTGASRDFMLCRYPEVAVFDRSKAGTPDAVYDAANWTCQAPRQT